MTANQVLSDIRLASEGIGEDRLRPVRDEHEIAAGILPCRIAGVIMAAQVPRQAELLLFASRLQARGWKLDGTLDAEGYALTSGEWDIFLGAGPVPEEFREHAGTNKGVIAVSGQGLCRFPSGRPR
ncbi:hypothetical protein ACE14D_19785 [Streptomyces sp. Act-28]